MLVTYAAQRFSLRLPAWITDEANVLSYFGTLWTVQTTIAALVYPIVIAFVAVLLRRRATAGLGLRIYMLDAAVLPAGTSAIGLVTWMGLQYLALPYLPGSWIGAAMTGNAAWFVLNSSLTAWFLYRTLRFLNDDERLEMFERFAVHVALPREVRSHQMLETLEHLRECQRQIAVDGLMVKGSRGQKRPHPLLKEVTESKRHFLACVRSLNLDLAPPE
jgi:hypothetical protein